MENTPPRLATWAIVELMGHNQMAGFLTERPVGATVMFQLDVPAVGDVPAYTRYLSTAAVYAINPCTEELARLAANSYKAMPVIPYDVQTYIRKVITKGVDAIRPPLGDGDPEPENPFVFQGDPDNDDDRW